MKSSPSLPSKPFAPHWLVCLSAVVAVAQAFADTPKPDQRPNILFIVVDDQSPFDLQVYNSRSELQTPNIDRLAKGGIVLDCAYHMGANLGAVCTPSRHMMMTGRSVWHLPTSPRASELSPPQLELSSLPAVFKNAGYATMRTCKKGNSYEAANKQFETRHDESKRGGDHQSGSGWHGDQVVEYLDRREKDKDDRPFMIWFGFSHPHDTRDGTPELLAKYGATNHKNKDGLPALNAKQPRLPQNYLSKHPFDNTDLDVRDEKAVSGVWQNRDEASIRNELGRQFACSENIDTQIGRVLDRLKESGELSNTIIVYTADHGIAIGRHGLMGKQNLYEHCWRVPLIVSGPSIKAGTRTSGNVYLSDLLATACDFATIQPPSTNEGTSFREVLTGQKDSIRSVMYGAYCGGKKPGMRCVREGDWKLIEYEAGDSSARQTQLFNLAENPLELLDEHRDSTISKLIDNTPKSNQGNLAADPQHAGRLSKMRELLLAEMRRLDDPYRFSFQPADGLPAVPTATKKNKR
jgi:choline-sulfatase